MGFLTATCEDCDSIDLAWLRRHSPMTVGSSGTIRWSRGGREIGAIEYSVESGGLRLTYHSRRADTESVRVDELIPFATTPVALGGRRQWFICLGCRQRCRILYGGRYFRCRRCHGLRYESQNEPAYARGANRCHKIRARLGQVDSLDRPFPPKPKGMHWRTYRRLEAEDARNQTVWSSGIMERWFVKRGIA